MSEFALCGATAPTQVGEALFPFEISVVDTLKAFFEVVNAATRVRFIINCTGVVLDGLQDGAVGG
jgi:hypothetical protein